MTLTSVEETVLGRGHEFMHEHEHEGMLAVLASWAARTEGLGAPGVLDVPTGQEGSRAGGRGEKSTTGFSVETRRGPVETLI